MMLNESARSFRGTIFWERHWYSFCFKVFVFSSPVLELVKSMILILGNKKKQLKNKRSVKM